VGWEEEVLTAIAASRGPLDPIMIAVGVLGEYLWRVLVEVRERPLYIVRERIGFEPGEAARQRRERQVHGSR